MATGVFIGRFQPFHKGHLTVIRKMQRECDRIIIILGTPTNIKTINRQNPFTTAERKKMLQIMLKKYCKIPWEINVIKDYNVHKLWLKNLRKKTPKDAIIYSGNRLVRNLCRNNGLKTRAVPHVIDIHATRIRKLINEGKLWKKYLPKEINAAINKIDINSRLTCIK